MRWCYVEVAASKFLIHFLHFLEFLANLLSDTPETGPFIIHTVHISRSSSFISFLHTMTQRRFVLALLILSLGYVSILALYSSNLIYLFLLKYIDFVSVFLSSLFLQTAASAKLGKCLFPDWEVGPSPCDVHPMSNQTTLPDKFSLSFVCCLPICFLLHLPAHLLYVSSTLHLHHLILISCHQSSLENLLALITSLPQFFTFRRLHISSYPSAHPAASVPAWYSRTI